MNIKCCICHKEISLTEGNNPYPVRDWSCIGSKTNRCCNECNDRFVIPARLMLSHYSEQEVEDVNRRLSLLSYNDLKILFP